MKSLLWSLGLVVMACVLSGCFGHLGASSPSGGGAGSPPTLTPIQRDLNALFTPVVWAAFAGGAILFALAVTGIFVIPFLSARTSAYSGLASMALGIGLLWLRDFVVAHTWIIPVVILSIITFLAWPWIHRFLVKAKSPTPNDNSTARDQLLALIPGLGKNIPTLSDPST